ncbi:FtsB family cell division protein [Ructibacterium gallinarum]|uniref:Septum formation initiator family protein n=1 Tax=Ructibacterium gallinarum TaxID=2779355 RepID=A0A9D5R992_9FIRM|nr:septum formation initiator family protein [Ructibacterium gallinarum]MBE5040254.1 septum formation initiator family protein [Ructibacterium gallinarum]
MSKVLHGKQEKHPSQAKSGVGSGSKRRLNLRRFLTVLLVFGFAVYFVYIMIWQQVTISRKNKEINALEEKISAANQQTEELQQQLDHLNDPEYLEQIAREKLGLVRPNERVFVDANKSEANQGD